MAGPGKSFALVFVAYSALRLAVFLVPLLIIYALTRDAVVSAVFATVIGLALSMILLARQRGSVAMQLQQRSSTRRVISDEAVEDDVIEAAPDQNDSAAASPNP